MHEFDYAVLPERFFAADIMKLLLEIREFKGKQELWAELQPQALDSLMDVARVESVGASNRIEGIATTERRLQGLMLHTTQPHGRDEQEIAGYRDVLALIHEQHDYIEITPNVILQLHRDLMHHTSFSFGGHWKDGDNAIVGINESGERYVRFRPTSAVTTPDAMERLCATYREAIGLDRYDTLLLVMRFVFDFLCIHPFNDGNGRMSRLLTVLLMERAGYSVGRYVSVERLIEDNKQLYYESLAESSTGWDENANNETPFIRFMLGIVLAAYRDLSDRMDAIGRGSAKRSKAQRVADIFDRRPGRITKDDIRKECPDISDATIERVLKQLLDEGRIAKVGAGRTTAYARV